MKGKVIISFGDAKHGNFSDGDVIEIPDGVDWVRAGFVIPITTSDIENAAIYPPERAIKKTHNPRKVKAIE